MRCPKCHYLSFEPEARCRNCGYDLALSTDLPIREAADTPTELADFDLHPREHRPRAAAPTLGQIRPDRETRPAPAPSSVSAVGLEEPEAPIRPRPPRAVRKPAPPTASISTSELPLFVQGLTSGRLERDEPAMPAASGSSAVVEAVEAPPALLPVPAVRRVASEPIPIRPGISSTVPELTAVPAPAPRVVVAPEPLPPAPPAAPEPIISAALSTLRAERPHVAEAEPVVRGVGTRERLAATSADVLLLGSIDIAIVWCTLRACDLTLSQIGLLPVIPMAAFLVLLSFGYGLLFTAAIGQTIGMMVAGIRVVGQDGDDSEGGGDMRPSIKQAVIRTAAALPLVGAFGAGLFPALTGRGQAIHDRIAHTRVIRA